jgi:replication factor A1
MDDDTTKTKPKSDSGDGEGGGGGGSVKKAKLSETSHAIRSLNPYLSQPTIEAKVTWKGDMTSWNNAKGSGLYFKMELTDKWNDRIMACFFNESAEKFYSLIEEDEVYTFKNGRVKQANQKFSTTEHELTFGQHASIQKCNEVSSSPPPPLLSLLPSHSSTLPLPFTQDIPAAKSNSQKIADLEDVKPNSTVNVLGIVKQIGDCQMFNSKKTDTPLVKRDIILIDDSVQIEKATL